MKPIKIVLQAFGPYRHRESIDFRELENNKLFLITGPTGAGKTTIFDGIAYALYGEASGDLRGSDSLRSQFADDDLLTMVELDFEVKGKKYNLKRLPKQMKPKSRGEGLTGQKPDATLEISNEIETKVVTGIKNVNDKVEEVLGLNAEQFRQIMMIPQGEFKKLLVASSEDRERILKKLFDTNIYNIIQNKLDVKSREFEAKLKDSRKLVAYELDKAKFLDDSKVLGEDTLLTTGDKIDLLADEIKDEEDQLKIVSEKKDRLAKEHEAMIKKIEKIKIDNSLILELSQNKERQKSLNDQKHVIDDMEKSVIKNNHTKAIVPIEEEIIKQVAMVKDYKESILNYEVKLKQCVLVKEKYQKTYDKLTSQERKDQVSGLLDAKVRLKSLEEKVLVLIEEKLQSEKLRVDISQYESLSKSNNSQIETLTSDVEKIKERIETGKNSELELKDVIIEYKLLNEIAKSLEMLSDLLAEKSKLAKEISLGQDKYKTSEDQYILNKKVYTESKMAYHMNQAALLAETLEAGNPCPVCGSKHHESLASFSGQAIRQDDLDKLDNDMRTAYEAVKTAEKELALIKASFKNTEDKISGEIKNIESKIIEEALTLDVNLSNGLTIESSLNALKIKIEAIKIKGAELRKKSDSIISDEKSLKECHEKIESLHVVENKNSEDLQGLKDAYIKTMTTLESLKKDIPLELREKEALISKIMQISGEIDSYNYELKEVSERLESETNREASLVGTLTTSKETILQYDQNVVELKNKMASKVDEVFINMDDYQGAKLGEDQVKTYTKKVEAYRNEVNLLIEKISILEEKTKDIELVSLELVSADLIELKARISQNEVVINDLSSVINGNKAVIEKIRNVRSKISVLEDEYSVIGRISKIANGKNPANVTFERYVQGAFLEDIIIAANVRLKAMSQGRYQLARSQALERKNRQSGLDLEVFDNYTGKGRSVKTLSGGESFKASLSMALGLSDVVQSYAGGVQLDTMFIDEGFGTLDQESLDSAINCLINLQEAGRLVGIISHVQELKERIDVQLRIEATNMGSKSSFVLPT